MGILTLASQRARRAATAGAVLAVLATAAPAPPLAAQVLRGRLLERESDRPIPMALLILIGTAQDSVARAITDDLGRFTLTAPRPGDYFVVASALGYEDGRAGIFELGAGGELAVDFRLTPDPLAVPGIEVTEELRIHEPPLVKNGFFDRLVHGAGYFITPADLAAADASRLTDVLSGVPFLTLVNAYPTDRILIQGSGALCTPAIIIDGLLASTIRGRRGSPNQIPGSEGDIEALVSLKEVEAIEVYRGGQQMPQQFTGMSRTECGAIIIWTKRR